MVAQKTRSQGHHNHQASSSWEHGCAQQISRQSIHSFLRKCGDKQSGGEIHKGGEHNVLWQMIVNTQKRLVSKVVKQTMTTGKLQMPRRNNHKIWCILLANAKIGSLFTLQSSGV